jgi:formylglycine-generating enzyme required for sulfatase activity
VNDGVEAAFAKALAIKPSDRWQSAGDFWQALRLALGLEPMTKVTDPTLRSRAVVGPAEPIATAPTMAAVSSDPSATAALTKTTDRTTTGRGAGSGRMGLFVALGVAAVAAIGAGVHTLRPKSTSATASAPAVSSAAASAAALPEAPACPSGMIHIPGGSFFMGSDDGLQLEKPAHQVTLAPYCIDRFEVTVEDYKACSDAGRCKRAGTANAWASITDKERKAFDPLCNARDPAMLAKHPINCVDWEMAEKFCREQGKRLPSEAEWEFAARGPDGRRYPWGDGDPAASHLNACGRECVAWGVKNGIEEKAMYDVDDGFANTAPVGSFPKGASRYGVEDVVGNVWEWVADWYGEYGNEELKDPTGPASGQERVIRGGAWNGSYPSWVRPTFRYKDTPSKRSYGIGFRCAR